MVYQRGSLRTSFAKSGVLSRFFSAPLICARMSQWGYSYCLCPTLRLHISHTHILTQNTGAAPSAREAAWAPHGPVRTPRDHVQTHCACVPTCRSGAGRGRDLAVLVATSWAYAAVALLRWQKDCVIGSHKKYVKELWSDEWRFAVQNWYAGHSHLNYLAFEV